MIKRLLIALCLFALIGQAQAGSDDAALAQLIHDWDVANFTLQGDAREKALAALAERAQVISSTMPHRAEPLVWQAIVLSSYAGAKGGFGALKLVTQARDILLRAEQIDAAALHGSVYTSLGSLYYQVPGWPIGFGDDDKARAYLEKALTLNPDGLESNYFYGDFLIAERQYKQAIAVLEKALAAPPQPGREVADTGRRQEVVAAIALARKKMNEPIY
jgi:tetratricopeptide (TPR) repeat protein